MNLKTQNGFTLIELSIVIVIIGLIVAGVVGGQALVKQAKLRSVILDINMFSVGVNTFYLEYNSLPGDMNNAGDYWSGAYEGNGNNRIDLGPNNGHNSNLEERAVWEHLELAGLITFEDDNSDGTYDTPYPDGNYVNRYSTTQNTLNFSGPGPISAGAYWQGILSSQQAYYIDSKMDDGMPATGEVLSTIGHYRITADCYNGPWPPIPSNTYILSDDDQVEKGCRMQFNKVWPK